jgi:hypothetical protein
MKNCQHWLIDCETKRGENYQFLILPSGLTYADTLCCGGDGSVRRVSIPDSTVWMERDCGVRERVRKT